MTEFTWEIETMQRDIYPAEAEGGVVTVCWKCTGVDVEKESSYMGVAIFTPDPTAPDYISYDDLTEEDVLGWCFAPDADGVSQVNVAEVEANIQAQMDWFPRTANGVPWS